MIAATRWLTTRVLPSAAAFGLALGAAELGAQEGQEAAEDPQAEECVLEPSDPVSAAAEALEAAREREGTGEDAAADYRRALEALQGPLEQGTDDPATLILAAQAHIGIGDYQEADGLLDRFEQLAPECDEAARNTRYNAWAEAYNDGIRAYQAGDEEAALASFEEANTIHGDPRSYNNAALLHRQRGDTDRAVELWREAVRSDGDAEQVRSAIENLTEVLRAEDRPDEAIGVYEEYLERYPDDTAVRIRYAMALQEAGRGDEATPILDDVMGREDLDAGQWNQIGIGFFDSENYERALEAFRSGREANPYAKDLMENMVSASIQADRPGEVAALADTLVNWYPYDRSSHQLKAHVLSRMGQGQQAMQALQRGEETPYVFQAIQMAQAGEDRWIVQGTLASREAGGGESLTLPFEFVGPDGEVVQTEEVSVQAPPAGQSTTVRVEVQSERPIAGFRYGTGGGA